jgi:hypothetical protein
MHQITRPVGRVFFRNLRCPNRAVYLRTMMLKSRHICMTTKYFTYFSARVITSPTKTRKLCDFPKITCWKCSYSYSVDANQEAVFFCPSCDIVQEPSSDKTYFNIMNWYDLKPCRISYLVGLEIIIMRNERW